jgi:hypothetical protein
MNLFGPYNGTYISEMMELLLQKLWLEFTFEINAEFIICPHYKLLL